MDQPPPYAEYPRPSTQPGFGRGPGVYFDAIGESWNVVRQDLGMWMAASLVTFILSIVPVLPIYVAFFPSFLSLQRGDTGSFGTVLVFEALLFVVAGVAQQFFFTGMVGLAVRKLRGEYVDIGMLFEPFRNFGRVLGASALFTLVMGAATLACVLPALFFVPVLLLMPTVAMLRGVSASEALSVTFDAFKGHWAGLLGLLIVTYLMVTVSVYICCIPVLITFPMAAVIMAIHYRAFFESQPAPAVPMG